MNRKLQHTFQALAASAAVFSLMAGIFHSYYQVVLRRSAPEAVLIPGDWQQLRSPRTTKAAAIIERYKYEDAGIHVLEALVLYQT